MLINMKTRIYATPAVKGLMYLFIRTFNLIVHTTSV